MAKNNNVTLEGVVVKGVKGAAFQVEFKLPVGIRNIISKVSGKLLHHKISIAPGDKVEVAIAPNEVVKLANNDTAKEVRGQIISRER